MDKTQIEKLRRMNLGGIADEIESIISRNARLTADNRRHMQRVEALERECGQMALHIKNGGSSLPVGWRLVPEKSNPEWIELLCELGYSTSPKSVIDHILAAAPKPPIPAPAQAATVPPEWREAVQEFVDRVERGEIRSSYTFGKFKALLGGVQ